VKGYSESYSGRIPPSGEAAEAHKRLASAYLIRGHYREALEQINRALAIKPDDGDARGVLQLLTALGESPDQSRGRLQATSLRLLEDGLPVSINGKEATYWFDTGANFSVMSESEAKRIGLKVREVGGSSLVSTGARVSIRLAVADQISLGEAVLRNVAFLVFPDDQPPFNSQPVGSRGLIGLPVLLALERFAWRADKVFEIGAKKEQEKNSRSNMCFDGNLPAVQVQQGDRKLVFVLDTGASNTDLFPPFAPEFPELIREAQKTDSYKMEGVGSTKDMKAATLESVQFVIGDFSVVLKPANVLLSTTGETSKFFEGNLGIDLLQQAREVVFDFGVMRLSLR